MDFPTLRSGMMNGLPYAALRDKLREASQK